MRVVQDREQAVMANIIKRFGGSFNLNGVAVRYRLGFLALLSISGLLLVGFGGWLGITKVSQSVVTLQEQRLPAVAAISDMRNSTNLLLQLSFEILTREGQVNPGPKIRRAMARQESLFNLVNQTAELYEHLRKTNDEARAWALVKDAIVAWKNSNEALNLILKAISDSSDPGQQKELFAQYRESLAAWAKDQAKVDSSLTELREFNQAEIAKTQELDTRTIKFSLLLMGVTLSVATVVLLLLAVFFVRSITKPLEQLRHTIVSVAGSNDFTERAHIRGRDEIAQTAGAFNRLLENVQVSLRDVLGNAHDISVASQKTLTASRQSAQSSESQSEAATAIAAAVEEMTVSITHISDNASETLGRARGAGEAASKGADSIAHTHTEMDKIATTVAQATAAIDKLSKESGSISTILKVIKDVADQTNLLALNAAIEAARAGEQGRGFAVVADEVRKLAERTAASTKAIGDLVISMQSSGADAVNWMVSVNRQVTSGKELSNVAVAHIASIHDSSKHVMSAVTDISEAIGEQSSAAQSIAQQVETVARLSETNNLTAKQTEAVSLDLDRLSASLREAISKFRV